MTRRTSALTASALVVAAACSDGDRMASADGRDPSIALATADTTTIDAPLELPGQLYVEHDAVVYARSAGVVESVHVDLGDQVERGALMARLESVDQEIALASARHTLANARLTVERYRALAGQGVVTPADSEHAELAFEQADLAHRQAERDHRLARVTAPFAGRVTARTVRPGRLVESGDSLFRVTALRPLLVSVRVPETASDVAVGSEATVTALDGRMAAARVHRVSPTVDAASGTREVVALLTETGGLRPGASVTVRLGAEPRRVVLVPQAAVTEDGYVLVWNGSRGVLRAVTLGMTVGGRREVVVGLTPGERVVLPGR